MTRVEEDFHTSRPLVHREPYRGSPRQLEITSLRDIDATVKKWLTAAYDRDAT